MILYMHASRAFKVKNAYLFVYLYFTGSAEDGTEQGYKPLTP